MLWDAILNKITYNVGVDLGTSSTLVSIEGLGIVAKEPSVVAINKKTNEILAVGDEAKKMVGRTPGDIVAIRPLKNGVITDFEMTEAMLRYFVQKAHFIAKAEDKTWMAQFRIPRPRVVVGVPSGITEVERRAVLEATTRAGAREVYIIEEPMAAAIGAHLPIENPSGSMIIDIGGGTSDIAIISLGQIVIDNTIRLAGDQIDSEIITFIKQKFGLQIGDRTAEDIKIALSDMLVFENMKKAEQEYKKKLKDREKIVQERLRLEDERMREQENEEKKQSKSLTAKPVKKKKIVEEVQETLSLAVENHTENIQIMDVEVSHIVDVLEDLESDFEAKIIEINPSQKIRGRDIKTGLPKEITVYASDLFTPISKVIDTILEAAIEAIEKAPPEILGDLLEQGIVIAGGGALIGNIDKYFEKKLTTPVRIANGPIECVAKGCTIVLGELTLLRKIQSTDE